MAKKINVKLILELRSAGMGRNAIAASRHISKNSVGDVFHIADRMGISYENIAQMDEDTVYRKFYPDKFALESLYDKPDYEYVHQELKRTGVTLKLLWQEYQDKCRASGNIPMGYTKYCQGYSEYTIVNKLTNHLEHKPGVAVEVDWSGPTMTYVDTSTGIFRKCRKNLWRAFGFALLVLIPVPIAITHISAYFLPQVQFDFTSDIFNSGITLALSLVCFGVDYLHYHKKGDATDKK